MSATNPTPQASFSHAGSYSPDFVGRLILVYLCVLLIYEFSCRLPDNKLCRGTHLAYMLYRSVQKKNCTGTGAAGARGKDTKDRRLPGAFLICMVNAY